MDLHLLRQYPDTNVFPPQIQKVANDNCPCFIPVITYLRKKKICQVLPVLDEDMIINEAMPPIDLEVQGNETLIADGIKEDENNIELSDLQTKNDYFKLRDEYFQEEAQQEAPPEEQSEEQPEVVADSTMVREEGGAIPTEG